MAYLIAALSAVALAAVLVRRRLRALPEAPRWRVAGRGGMAVRFACGHVDRRVGAFVCETRRGPVWYRRNVWRCKAEESSCHACFVVDLVLAGGPDEIPDDPAFRRFRFPRP